jgi:hypothetical protein
MFLMTVFALACGAGMYWATHWLTVTLMDSHLQRDKRIRELVELLPHIKALLRRAAKEKPDGAD